MKIAFVIYDGMTALDFIGAYDPLTRLKTMGFMPDVTWDICAVTPEVRDGTGLRFIPTRVGESLAGYDLVYVPGGFGTRTLAADRAFLAWLATARDSRLLASVCTGSLLLGAAGLLAGRRATSHPSAYDDLRAYTPHVVDARVVDEGDLVTGRGVSSAIDLGLYLVQRIAGPEVAARIKQQMDYPYGP
ncbi:MAG: DJ-1/PfpI family protein [Sphaerobacter sp.]|nr:DJ-1/PfpI family protein [Sphaerobacter sp.]